MAAKKKKTASGEKATKAAKKGAKKFKDPRKDPKLVALNKKNSFVKSGKESGGSITRDKKGKLVVSTTARSGNGGIRGGKTDAAGSAVSRE